jgi:uncharacterized protein YkwD
MSGALVAAPAAHAEEIPADQVVLHNVPKNQPFKARTVRVWIPKTTSYDVRLGSTHMDGFRTVRRLAKSDGQRVFVKVGKTWVPVPYSYRAPGNVLHFEESLRLVMGLTKDPLGAPRPTYVWPAEPFPTPEPRPVPSSPRYPDTGETTSWLGSTWREDMLARVNTLRAAAGVAPARLCLPLNDSATYKAQSMASVPYYGHHVPAGYPYVSDVARESGGRGVWGENIAFGLGSVVDVVDAWRNSPGHYRNMVDPRLVVMGFGAGVSSDGTPLWAQHFGEEGYC